MKKANYKLVGFTFRYSIRGKLIRKESGFLVSIHLQNTITGKNIILSDCSNPCVYDKVIELFRGVVDMSSVANLELYQKSNEIILSFDVTKAEVSKYHPKDLDIDLVINPIHSDVAICQITESLSIAAL